MPHDLTDGLVEGSRRVEETLDGAVRVTTPGGSANILKDGQYHSTLTAKPEDYVLAEDMLDESGLDLHGVTKAPKILKKRETFRDRLIMYEKALGKTNKSIAEKLGITESTVSLIVNQPWFRLALTQLMAETGKDALEETIKAEGMQSFWKIVELRDTAKSEAIQSASAFKLLDRWLGKEVQPITTEAPKRAKTTEELDAEIAATQRDLDALEGKSTT